jgi:hypothetical protein
VESLKLRGRAPQLQARTPAREFSAPTFRENSTPSDSTASPTISLTDGVDNATPVEIA